MEVKIQRKADPNIEFPSITVCNINPLRASQLSGPFSGIYDMLQLDDKDMLYEDYIEDLQEDWSHGE